MRFFSKRNHRVKLIAIIKNLRGIANLGRRFLRGAVQICDLVNSTCARLAQERKLQALCNWLRATAQLPVRLSYVLLGVLRTVSLTLRFPLFSQLLPKIKKSFAYFSPEK